mgnify:CR=1 FL=1
MILETKKHTELHSNGSIWIDGQIGIVDNLSKHLYDVRSGFTGFEGKPVCRIGKWTKHFDNGQLAWTIDYGDGTFDCKKESFPQYRKDGTTIVYN